jgi:dTMP kinase
MNKKGLLITFEGIDGAGKTTQLNLLYEELVSKHIDVVKIREPGSTDIGERIRGLLADRDMKILPYTELLLFFASRVQLIEQVINPAIEKGKIILCDRFHDATVAYQSYGRGLSLDVIKSLEKMFILPLKPDKTFLLDCSYNVARKRLSKRDNKTRIEIMNRVFFEKVRTGYLTLAKHETDRIVVIDANNNIERIKEQIRDNFYRWINTTRYRFSHKKGYN